MAKVNTKVQNTIRTHEGAPAKRISPEAQLRRSLMACLLWEDTFYEDGIPIVDRIARLVPQVDPDQVAAMAVEAHEQMKLRHAPLLVVREMARYPGYKEYVANTLSRVIQRADELSEFVAIYWKDGKQPLSSQVKKGLARAFPKFDAYQLAKYNRDYAVKLRDVLFLCHAKPRNEEQAALWKQLINGTLPSPDTWEVALSTGQGKREAFTRLLKEGKLGALALLRNLHNMTKAGVQRTLIQEAIENMKTERILPFRFIAAARHAGYLEDSLEKAMFRCLQGQPKLPGKTVLLVDVSYSMTCSLSYRSDMRRADTAIGLSILAREICEDVKIYTFSDGVVQVAPRRGFALRDAIVKSQEWGLTYLGEAVRKVNEEPYDRLIVLTDEQSHDEVPNPKGRGYMINIASYKNGVGYGKWLHIDGWSEAVLRYIAEHERVKV